MLASELNTIAPTLERLESVATVLDITFLTRPEVNSSIRVTSVLFSVPQTWRLDVEVSMTNRI